MLEKIAQIFFQFYSILMLSMFLLLTFVYRWLLVAVVVAVVVDFHPTIDMTNFDETALWIPESNQQIVDLIFKIFFFFPFSQFKQQLLICAKNTNMNVSNLMNKWTENKNVCRWFWKLKLKESFNTMQKEENGCNISIIDDDNDFFFSSHLYNEQQLWS